mmetsp:Transcript_62497/g.116166  ORF Transcript_62497/g.116166 Transcript_62497/m.116166 type:complete len:218 (+) Transcript_62497:952-1605(+)
MARATCGSRSICACFSRSAVKNCIAICLLFGAVPPEGLDDTGIMRCVARAIDTITGGGIGPGNIPPEDGIPGAFTIGPGPGPGNRGAGICPNNGGWRGGGLAVGGGGAGAKPLVCDHCPSRGMPRGGGPPLTDDGMLWPPSNGGRIILGRLGSSSPLGIRGLCTKLPLPPPKSICGTAGESAPPHGPPPPPFPLPGGPMHPMGGPGLHPLPLPMYIP